MLPNKNECLQVMSHAVVGFPCLEENEKAIAQLINVGIKLIELQVPFSDPVADGHTLTNACYKALQQGGSVPTTLRLAQKVSRNHPDACFILMSYLNPLYRYGLEQLFRDAAASGIRGLLVPDMPVEEYEPWLPLLAELRLAPILIIAPNTPNNRVERILNTSVGMVYVVSRLGVTGGQTKSEAKEKRWGREFQRYIARIRQRTELPIAVGFGIRSADDLRALKGTVEVAAFCSKYIEWQLQEGSLRAAENMRQLLIESGLKAHLSPDSSHPG